MEVYAHAEKILKQYCNKFSTWFRTTLYFGTAGLDPESRRSGGLWSRKEILMTGLGDWG